jgi:hypothetical protein
MSAMVERIARKLCTQAGYDPDSLEPGNDPYGNNVSTIDGHNAKGDPCHFRWRGFEKRALEVIATMREPTKAMALALLECARHQSVDPGMLADCWYRMMDATLA